MPQALSPLPSLKASAAILRGVPLRNVMWHCFPWVHSWETGLGHLQKGLAGSFQRSGES